MNAGKEDRAKRTQTLFPVVKNGGAIVLNRHRGLVELINTYKIATLFQRLKTGQRPCLGS